jgi:hypothetical protein
VKWKVTNENKNFARIVEELVSEDTKVTTQDSWASCVKYAEGIQEEV